MESKIRVEEQGSEDEGIVFEVSYLEADASVGDQLIGAAIRTGFTVESCDSETDLVTICLSHYDPAEDARNELDCLVNAVLRDA